MTEACDLLQQGGEFIAALIDRINDLENRLDRLERPEFYK